MQHPGPCRFISVLKTQYTNVNHSLNNKDHKEENFNKSTTAPLFIPPTPKNDCIFDYPTNVTAKQRTTSKVSFTARYTYLVMYEEGSELKKMKLNDLKGGSYRKAFLAAPSFQERNTLGSQQKRPILRSLR